MVTVNNLNNIIHTNTFIKTKKLRIRDWLAVQVLGTNLALCKEYKQKNKLYICKQNNK